MCEAGWRVTKTTNKHSEITMCIHLAMTSENIKWNKITSSSKANNKHETNTNKNWNNNGKEMKLFSKVNRGIVIAFCKQKNIYILCDS